MAILFAASELESFNIIDVANTFITTNTSHFNPAYSRSAFRCDYTAKAKAIFTPQTELWVHFYMGPGPNASSNGNDYIWFELYDSVNAKSLFTLDADDGINNLEYWNGSTYIERAEFNISDNTKTAIDIHLKIGNPNGIYRLYKDGILSAQYLGNTSFVPGASINQAIFGGWNQTTTTYGPYYSEIIVATEPTIGWHLFTLAPTNNGANSEWTGNYQDIDESIINNDDFIYSTIANQTSTFILEDKTLPTNFEIKGVSVGAQVRRGETGPQNLELVVRAGGTNYTSGDVSNIELGWTGKNYIWPVNPNTGLQWTQSEVNSLEAGVKSKT